MTYNPEITGNIIMKLRKAKKWSRATLGEKLDVSEKQIYLYEIGKTMPPLDRLFTLCEMFNCELGYLLGEASYKDGTQLNTAICESLGITRKAVDSLRIVTRRGLTLEFVERQQIISQFFESPFLGEFFDCLVDAVTISNRLALSGDTVYDNLAAKYGEETAMSAIKVLLFSSVDETDTAGGQDETELQKAVKELDDARELSRNDEYAFKVAKYELREAFETLVRNIF